MNVMMIGLPNTGKTTYLAALWYIVTAKDEEPDSLKLASLRGDKEYLNDIQATWLSFRKVERTKRTAEATAYMELQTDKPGESLTLVIPDLSGERFRQQFEERTCESDYVEMARKASSLMLFVHTGEISKPVHIIDAQEIVELMKNKETGMEHKDNESSESTFQIWDPSLAPTQVKAVDLLQIYISLFNRDQPIRVALILSAWDLIGRRRITPQGFVKLNLPLLHQYLTSNDELFNCKFFGVSAQGGPLDTDQQRRELSKYRYNPTRRIIVQVDNTTSNDISLPLKWFIS